MIDPELLQTMLQDPAAGRTLAQRMLAERAAADPQLAALVQMMSAQPDDGADRGHPRPSGARQRIRDRVREMRAELAILRERTNQLAAALGACARCWGGDPTCGACGGCGAPGWLAPDLPRFTELVAPTVARLAREHDDPDHGDNS